jgi:hypothetical protein
LKEYRFGREKTWIGFQSNIKYSGETMENLEKRLERKCPSKN